MKTAKVLVILFLFICVLVEKINHANNAQKQVEGNYQHFLVKKQAEKVVKSTRLMMKEEYKAFVDALAFAESGGNYYAISPSGSYRGKYQFGWMALKDIGMTIYEYNSSYLNQEKAMLLYLRKNYIYLEDYIKEYSGVYINGIKITKSGILAAAHLVGHGDVILYLESNGKIITKDGNNVSLEVYLNSFSGYTLHLFKQKINETVKWIVYNA